MLKEVFSHIRPVYVEDCLGEHRVRSLARVGSINMVNQILGICLRLATTICLSRILPPSTFGLIAMVAFFRGLMDMVSGSGFVESAIQKKTLTLDELNGVFWLNLGLSAALAIIFIFSGPFIADFYGEPEIAAMCTVIGLLFILENLFKTHDALLRRTMNAEVSFVVFLLPQFVNLPVAIVLALLGFEVWSIIAASVFSAIAQRLLYMYFVRWSPGRPQRAEGFGSMVKYGLNSMSASIVNYCSMYAQNLALGKFGSASDVGFYNRGQAIFLMPVQLVSQPIAQMLLPSLSVLQHDKEKLLSLLLRATWLVVLIVMPFTLFMIVYGDWAIELLLGEQWLLSGEVTQWLAVASVPVLVCNLIGRGNAAIGRPGRGVPVAILALPFLLYGVVTYASSGPVAISIVYALYRWVFYPISISYHLKGSGFSTKEFVFSQLSLFAIIVPTFLILAAVRYYLNDSLGVTRIGVMVVTLIISYAIFLFSFRYYKYGRQVLDWIYQRFGKKLPLLKVIIPSH
jgi:PST family polysaccharide transporter